MPERVSSTAMAMDSMHREAMGDGGMGGGMDEYGLRRPGTHYSQYHASQPMYFRDPGHRDDAPTSHSAHGARMALEYQQRMDVQVPYRQHQPQHQPQQQPQRQLQQHQHQRVMRPEPRATLPAPQPAPTSGSKRGRKEIAAPTSLESTSSKRSRAEKHYKEIKLLCDALAPHISEVKVCPPSYPASSFSRLCVLAGSRADILSPCLVSLSLCTW
jgi:hypothetical protein